MDRGGVSLSVLAIHSCIQQVFIDSSSSFLLEFAFLVIVYALKLYV